MTRLFRRNDGEYAFAAAADNWFGMPKTNDALMSVSDAMHSTGMDRMRLSTHSLYSEVDVTESTGQMQLPQRIKMPRDKGVILTEEGANRRTPVGVVGAKREVFQFDELIEPMDTVLDVSGGHIEAAGLMASGAEWFCFIRLPESVVVGGDSFNAYLLGRDGLNSSFVVSGIGTRLWCFNMFTAAVNRARRSSSAYRLMHTQGAKISVAEIRQQIKLTYTGLDELSGWADKLLDQSMSTSEFEGYIEEVFDKAPPVDAPTRTHNAWWRRRNRLVDLFEDSDTTASTYRGGEPTRWTAYQAVTEYLDHYAPMRGNDSSRRLERVVGRQFDNAKDQALKALI